jgi:LysM repeat protein
VREGETLIDIAILYDLTVDEILAMDPNLDPDLIQAGQILLIPAATPTPGPTSTFVPGAPTPTPAASIIYIVKPGDTLSTIAEEHGVSMQVIIDANGLASEEETIRPNQSLVIPQGTPAPTPTPTIDPNATPTPIPPYPSPPLLGPPNGALFEGSDEPILLQWASVSVLDDDEWYELDLSQPPGGVVSDTIYTRATAWRVPFDLLLTANANVREFYWQVRVVREAGEREGEPVYEEAGAPSNVRVFTWLEPTPTPGSSSTP